MSVPVLLFLQSRCHFLFRMICISWSGNSFRATLPSKRPYSKSCTKLSLSRCKDCVLWDWHSLHLSASCKATLKAPTPALKFVRHYFGHSVICIYKITKIVRALWLAERRVCMRVCKHGCDVKMFCFSRANHVSTNLKKFSSSILDKFTLFTHSLVGWNLEICTNKWEFKFWYQGLKG